MKNGSSAVPESASRETELIAKFPAKDVSSWLGNSIPVAMRHYEMATEQSFREAAGLNGGCIGGCISTDSGVISGSQTVGRSEEKRQKSTVFPLFEASKDFTNVAEEGLEQSNDLPGNSRDLETAVALAVASDPELRRLIEIWPDLSQADRNSIIAIAAKG